jgi:hypothetical protein
VAQARRTSADREIVLTIDAQRFVCPTESAALALLEQAVALARTQCVMPTEITTNTRRLRSAVNATKRELKRIWMDREIKSYFDIDLDNEAIALLL